LKFGEPPDAAQFRIDFPTQTEEALYQQFCDHGIPENWQACGTAGASALDMYFAFDPRPVQGMSWEGLFGVGLARGVSSAVEVAGGYVESLNAYNSLHTPAERARSWFIGHYPLLGALAAGFKIIENAQLCISMGISIGAVDAESKEIFMNPAAGLDEA